MSTTVANFHSHLNVCYEKLFPREPSTFQFSRHEERMANMHQSIKTILLQLSFKFENGSKLASTATLCSLANNFR